jgi:hypothetical protein
MDGRGGGDRTQHPSLKFGRGQFGATTDLCETRSFELYAVQCQRPLDTVQVKTVDAENFQVPQPIPQTQLVVCLQFVPMTGTADRLEVFTSIRVPCP